MTESQEGLGSKYHDLCELHVDNLNKIQELEDKITKLQTEYDNCYSEFMDLQGTFDTLIPITIILRLHKHRWTSCATFEASCQDKRLPHNKH